MERTPAPAERAIGEDQEMLIGPVYFPQQPADSFICDRSQLIPHPPYPPKVLRTPRVMVERELREREREIAQERESKKLREE